MQLTAVSMAHNAENVLLVLHLPLRDFAQYARSEKCRTKNKTCRTNQEPLGLGKYFYGPIYRIF